jgi:hypothetical protein
MADKLLKGKPTPGGYRMIARDEQVYLIFKRSHGGIVDRLLCSAKNRDFAERCWERLKR